LLVRASLDPQRVGAVSGQNGHGRALAYPHAADFLAQIDEYWGGDAHCVTPGDSTVFCAACPACRSKSNDEHHLRYPLVVHESDEPGRWQLTAMCGCFEDTILATLNGTLPEQLDGADPLHELTTIRASSVPPETVDYLWQGWIPLGMLSLLAGLPGLGKTTLAIRLTAEATRGELEGSLHGEPVDVLVASLEDALAATLVPRLIAAGADLERVHFVACKAMGDSLDLTRHLPEIDLLAERHNARFFWADPLVATLPAAKMSSHSDQHVRSVLAPLAALAEKHDLAAMGLMHFSKSAIDALLGIGGSIGFVGAARSVLIFGADPTDDRGEEGPARVIAQRKSNVGRRQRSRECWIQSTVIDTDDGEKIGTSLAIVGDEIDVTADQLVAVRDHHEKPIVHATKFLRGLLADGPMRAREVYELAADEDIAKRTLDRAKRDLDVDSFQKDGGWWWFLPEEEEPPEEEEEKGE
jgi:putative DNA primase/helicase